MYMILPHFFQKLFDLPRLSLAISSLIFIIFLYKSFFCATTNKIRLPPSPPKLPIVGNLLQLGSLSHRSLKSLSEEYGKLMLLYFGSKPVYIVSSAEIAREIFKTHDIVFSNRPQSLMSREIFYNGKDIFFAPYGEHYRKLKSTSVIRIIGNNKVRSFQKIREEETALVVEKIRRSSHTNSVVNLSDTFMTLMTDIVCRAAFGRKYSGDSEAQLVKDMAEALGGYSIGDFIPCLGWIDRVTGLHNRVKRIAKQFDVFIGKIVQEHLDSLSNKHARAEDEPDYQGKNVKDLVDIMLQVHKEDSSALPIESIKALVLDIFAAATETTYIVLEWVMTELIRHPKIMKAVQEEVRKIALGQSRALHEEDVENMKYLKAIIKETLRLHPPGPLMARDSTQNVKINGYDIPANTSVYINIWAIHRDSAYWEDPDKFRPERFIESSSVDFKGQDQFQFIPFGGGRRGCPGISFAVCNVEFVLASLLLEFNWKLPGGEDCTRLDVTEKSGATAGRRFPLKLLATPRNGSTSS